ncbi:MAG: DUF1549 domain-containing protein [Planctomycetia bacterium]
MDMPVLPIVRRKCLRSARRLGSGSALLTRAFATVLAAALPVGTLHAAEAAAGPTAGTRIEISTGEPAGGPLHVIGTEGRRQLVVSAVPAGADADHERDVTRQASYRVEPDTLATVTPEGVVIPSADGQGEIVISVSAVPGLTDLPETRVPLVVERFGNDPPVEFFGRVVPVFTKFGCNSGGCHGKSGGQNGFRLSLLGFEPAEDHEHLVKEARGRRISTTAPDESLLLLKAAAVVPHGGGRLIETGSPSYRLISRWIAEGAQPGDPQAPAVVGIEVFPTVRVMHPGQSQQVRVMAILSDGSREDVTPMAQYEVNAPELASVDKTGLVSAAERGNGPPRSGVAALMVRYQSQVAVFRATVPLESPIDLMPARNAFARNFIDGHVLDNLVSLSLPPSGRCDDATFLRRVTIDIAGRVPALDETQAFLADSDPNKRDKLVDRLLDSPDYADTFANKWSAILRNKRTDDTLHRHGSYSFHEWIRSGLAENKPYDQFVRDIVSASGEASGNPATIWYRQVVDTNQQVEDLSQLFLGLRLQCARCHHHPFEKWSTADYYQLSAFFSRIGRKKGAQPGEDQIFHNRGPAQAAGPKATHQAAVLGGKPAELAADVDPRTALVDWMTTRDNPFFARSLVNRYWKHFFSRGLVEPEDDMRLTNPPTNPPLLDALAADFVHHGYDLKHLVRTICRSNTYQLSAEPNEFNAEDRQSFSRFYPRRLPAEVALDAIDTLTAKQTAFGGTLAGTRSIQLPDPNFGNYFLTVFGRPNGDSACECERVSEANLAQSIHLINSADILGKLGGDGRAAKLVADQGRDDAAKVAELYLVSFSRPPSTEENGLVQKYLEGHGDNRQAAYEDVIWSLLNTKEFLFNH